MDYLNHSCTRWFTIPATVDIRKNVDEIFLISRNHLKWFQRHVINRVAERVMDTMACKITDSLNNVFPSPIVINNSFLFHFTVHFIPSHFISRNLIHSIQLKKWAGWCSRVSFHFYIMENDWLSIDYYLIINYLKYI